MSAYFSHVTGTGDALTLRMHAKHREGDTGIDSLTIEASDARGSTHSTFQATRPPVVLIGQHGDPTTTTTLAVLMAAPDMLEALLDLDDLCPRVSEDDPIAPALRDSVRRARAAIAKATAL